MTPRLGYYGKIAALGDFIRRDLPAGFAEPWDRWLQEGMTASRAELGADWLARYQVAPLWRFALGPRLCGPAAVAGVMMPSADRVGRLFPLALVLPLPAAEVRSALDDEPAFAAIEELLLDTLEPAFGRAALDAAVDRLSPPRGAPGAPLSGSLWRARTEDRETELCCTGLPPPRLFASFLDLSAERWNRVAA